MSSSLKRWVNLEKTWYGPQGPENLKRPRNFHTKRGWGVTRLAYLGQ